MINYFFQKIKPTIAMVLLVKNEEDIIEKNIRFHAKMGVDYFVIMDNDSDDNTRDILNSLKQEFDLTVIDEKSPYSQSKFMTHLNKIAKKRSPDWIINSDADEFWMAKDGLKNALNIKAAVLKVPRSNMIIWDKWWESEYRVANQVHYQENPNIILTKIGRKVIINPNGYIKTNSGNHSAEHLIFWQKKEFKDIHIYHYPIRSYAQFEKTIKNRAKLLKLGAKMGSHYKRWAKIYEEGKLKEEFERMKFKKDTITCLEELNILQKDTIIKDLFEKFGI